MRPGVTRPRSMMYATRMVKIDFGRHEPIETNLDIEAVSRTFANQSRTKIELGGVNNERERSYIKAARLGNGVLRIGMFPKQLDQFSRLIAPIAHLPDDTQLPDSPELAARAHTMRHFVYADIPARIAGDNEVVDEALESISYDLDPTHAAISRRYFVQPSGLDRRVL